VAEGRKRGFSGFRNFRASVLARAVAEGLGGGFSGFRNFRRFSASAPDVAKVRCVVFSGFRNFQRASVPAWNMSSCCCSTLSRHQ
jgi:hypothetical protein